MPGENIKDSEQGKMRHRWKININPFGTRINLLQVGVIINDKE